MSRCRLRHIRSRTKRGFAADGEIELPIAIKVGYAYLHIGAHVPGVLGDVLDPLDGTSFAGL
jgi:hypothetical protein